MTQIIIEDQIAQNILIKSIGRELQHWMDYQKNKIERYKPGTPCSYSYYIHKKITYAECLRTERMVYHSKWRRVTHVSWLMSMPIIHLFRMIDQGHLYMVRKNKSGRRVV